MVLETLKGLKEINGEKIIVMDELREQFPEKFNESGAMDYKWFEKDIRPHNFIYVRHDVNSISFTIQNGPIKEVGKNGCQVVDMLALTRHIFDQLNSKFPCHENEMTVTAIDRAIFWQEKRTRDREQRNVEGTNKA